MGEWWGGVGGFRWGEGLGRMRCRRRCKMKGEL